MTVASAGEAREAERAGAQALVVQGVEAGGHQGAWTDEDRSYMRIAYEKRLEWIRRFHALGGTVVVGTDMQFGGIMVHEELRQLEAAGL